MSWFLSFLFFPPYLWCGPFNCTCRHCSDHCQGLALMHMALRDLTEDLMSSCRDWIPQPEDFRPCSMIRRKCRGGDLMLVGANKGRELEVRSTSFLHLVVIRSLMHYLGFPVSISTPFSGITFQRNCLHLYPWVRRNPAGKGNQGSIAYGYLCSTGQQSW